MEQASFRLFDPPTLRDVSVLEVTHADLFDKRGLPKLDGLFDPRLGTVSREYRCKTCRLDISRCPGHIGHIELHTPLFHVLTLAPLLKVLQCVCPNCVRVMVPADEPDPKTFGAVHAKCKRQRACPHCQAPIPKYAASNGVVVRNGDPWTGNAAYFLLHRLPESERRFFTHLSVQPEHLLLQVLPVPAPHIHPPVRAGTKRSLDDLTTRYCEILRTNAALKTALEDPKRDDARIFTLRTQLQNLVTSLFDSDAVVLTTRNTRPFRGIAQRIKGKEGRIRGNLTGKRVDFSSRTVLTGDPTLALHEVGVPESIARTLTVPETVHAQNRTQVDRWIRNGWVKTITRASGITVDVRLAKGPLYVQPGDRVERCLRDGDPVIFNRQPTLHRMSMMAHRVRVLPGKTFRINLSATAPYNADCDGDELNVHAPQTHEARAELAVLMDVRNHIVSSQSNRPVISFVQDTTLALHLLTQDACWLTRAVAETCWWAMHGPRGDATWVRPFPDPDDPEGPRWHGRQIVSCALPTMTVQSGEAVIDRGHLVRGRLSKKNLGGNHGLVHCVWQIFGPETCGNLISSWQWLAHAYLSHRGFSIGLVDMLDGLDRGDDVRNHVRACCDDVVDTSIRAYRKGLTRNDMEPAVVAKLDYARDASGTTIQNALDPTNALGYMVESGAKGSRVNISQICACVGQQHVEGARPKPSFDGVRCVPHFEVGDPDPSAYGFIRGSYLDGLGPTDCFFHAQAGREGVVDTAIKTSDSGYVQRKFVKLLEDVYVSYDETIRDSRGHVYQFEYGGDGFDGTFHMHQTYGGKTFLLPFVIEDALAHAPECDDEVDTSEWNEHWCAFAKTVRRTDPEKARACLAYAEERRRTKRIGSGTPIGVQVAQSLGEVSTQLTLNSFHTSGVGGSITTGGVPRLKELVNLNKDTKTEVVVSVSEDVAKKVVERYGTIPLGPCIESVRILEGSDRKAACAWSFEPIPEGLTCACVHLHRSKLAFHGLEIADVVACILRDMTIAHAWGTDVNAPQPCVYVTLPKPSQLPLFASELRPLWIRAPRGGIGDAVFDSEQRVVRLLHTSLADAWSIEMLDGRNTWTNSVLDAFAMLGVEAARAVFLREVKAVFANAGSYLHAHNYELLADVMFQTGEPKPINRYGVRNEKSVLGKASFETSMQTLTMAAVEGRTDRLTGTSERIMTGKRVGMGTGLFDLRDTDWHRPAPVPEEPEVPVFAPSSPPRMEEPEPSDLPEEETSWFPDEETSWLPSEETSWFPDEDLEDTL